ncbi:MAG: hypothetical protein LLF89_01195 [Spirochaetaceae bacterium]|nr:hypothetical protein [Spirochaetaceae bacterium]
MDFGLVFMLISALGSAEPETAESLLFRIVPRQGEASSCGYAVTAGLLKLWDRQVRPQGGEAISGLAGSSTIDEAGLIARYGQSAGQRYDQPDQWDQSEPLSLASMVSILSDFGICALPLRGGLDMVIPILQSGHPLVIHYVWPRPHYALGLAAGDGQVFLADPADGLEVLSYGELESRMSGYALLPYDSGAAMAGTGKSDEAVGIALEREDLLEKGRQAKTGGGLGQATGNPSFQYEAGLSLRSPSGPRLPFDPELQFSGEYSMHPMTALFFKAGLGCSGYEAPAAAASANIFAGISARASLAAGAIHWLGSPLGSSAGRPENVKSRRDSADHGIWAAADAEYVAAGAGLALPGQWSIAPYIGFLSSRVVSPALLASNFGLGLEWGIGSDSCQAIVLSSLSADYALTGQLAVETEIEQEFRARIAQNPAFSWHASLLAGLQLPFCNSMLGIGIMTNLSAGNASGGGVYIRVGR